MDNSTINAERAEARTLRAEWVRLDNLRQRLERENAKLRQNTDNGWIVLRNYLAGAISRREAQAALDASRL